MKIYDSTPATNTRRLRMFLVEKGIVGDIPRIEVDIFGGENLGEEYRKINPRGVLPTLELDDGRRLDETPAICRYLEELYPQINLMGSDAWSRALIESRARQIEFDGLQAMADIFRNTVMVFSSRALPGVSDMPAIPELVTRGEKRLEIFFQRFNHILSESEYVAGDKFSFADITGFCVLDNFSERCLTFSSKEHPHIQRWFSLCKDRPSVQWEYAHRAAVSSELAKSESHA